MVALSCNSPIIEKTGKEIYNNKCLQCHGFNPSSSEIGKISLYEMSLVDSLKFQNNLQKVLFDSIHLGQMSDINLDKKTIIEISRYIKRRGAPN